MEYGRFEKNHHGGSAEYGHFHLTHYRGSRNNRGRCTEKRKKRAPHQRALTAEPSVARWCGARFVMHTIVYLLVIAIFGGGKSVIFNELQIIADNCIFALLKLVGGETSTTRLQNYGNC